jgi:1-acyl-sn-glycerol-3-phosphate acyltransferase
MIRSLILLVVQVVTVIPVALMMLCLFWAPRKWLYWWAQLWLRINIWGLTHICGIRWRVIGAEHLPDEPVILLSKHQSTWETFFFPVWMPRELCYVFKRELLFIPFFGWGIGLLDMIHINRSKRADAFEQVVTQGTRKLSEDRCIIMFPEGTRTPVGSQGIYKAGGARLAVRTGAKVVPIAHNAGEVWPKKHFVKKPGLVTVSIGPAISSKDRAPETVLAEVETWIEAEMRRISPHAYRT